MTSKQRYPLAVLTLAALVLLMGAGSAAAQKKPNIVMLMTDDTGWNDFGAYSGGGAALGHPTPNIDRITKEGALFTIWYGQIVDAWQATIADVSPSGADKGEGGKYLLVPPD